ncbi:hypothetical protein [Thermophagus xiamenensis]|uniref:hypothetical protein n=1 Tax=Thermophagus xiamenensis TaxID=385682 RepID=UPI000255CD88|nr:hypothetical protein [Thermophagus xiamenensis]
MLTLLFVIQILMRKPPEKNGIDQPWTIVDKTEEIPDHFLGDPILQKRKPGRISQTIGVLPGL